MGLNKVTQQTIDIVFVGEMLKSTYNQIKKAMDAMVNNNQ